ARAGKAQSERHVALEIPQLTHFDQAVESRLDVGGPAVRRVRVGDVDGDLDSNLAGESHVRTPGVGDEPGVGLRAHLDAGGLPVVEINRQAVVTIVGTGTYCIDVRG